MGVDIYFRSDKKDFSCRLYWINNLVDNYSWRYKGKIPELTLEKQLTEKETIQLSTFLEFTLFQLKKDKKKALDKFDEQYFKKTEGVGKSVKQLIALLKKKKSVEVKLFPKLQGLLRRLESFEEIYGQDPEEQKEEIAEEFNERISLIKKIIPLLNRIVTKGGLITIG